MSRISIDYNSFMADFLYGNKFQDEIWELYEGELKITETPWSSPDIEQTTPEAAGVVPGSATDLKNFFWKTNVTIFKTFLTFLTFFSICCTVLDTSFSSSSILLKYVSISSTMGSTLCGRFDFIDINSLSTDERKAALHFITIKPLPSTREHACSIAWSSESFSVLKFRYTWFTLVKVENVPLRSAVDAFASLSNFLAESRILSYSAIVL